jgi:predicted Zn-dependent peptidase
MRGRGATAVLLLSALLAACAGPAASARPEGTAAPGAASTLHRVPGLGPPPELRIPPQRKFVLGNGLAVRLVESHRLPIVAIHLVLLEGGAGRDPRELPGVASFTAAMVTEGTRTRSATQISDEIGFLGASLGAGAGMDAAFVSGYSLSRHLPKLVELLADVVVNPTFPPPDFQRVQDQRRVALLQQRDQPGAVASKAFTELWWGDHPYGHWTMGTEASVAATTRADLARFHAARWRPGAAELVVVGDVEEAPLRALLDEALGGWAGREPPAPLPARPPDAVRRAVLIEKAKAPQTFLMLGMPGLARGDPDYVPTQVLFRILGGGSSSRLFRNLREEKGYTYGMWARESAQRLGGVSYVGGSVRADATGQAVRDLLDEVEALRTRPVPEDELADARNAIALSLPAEFSSVAGIAGKLAEAVVHGLPDDWWARYPAAVQAVGAADVQRVARRWLDTDGLLTVMVGDAAAVRPQLDGLPVGKVEERPTPAEAPPAGAARGAAHVGAQPGASGAPSGPAAPQAPARPAAAPPVGPAR